MREASREAVEHILEPWKAFARERFGATVYGGGCTSITVVKPGETPQSFPNHASFTRCMLGWCWQALDEAGVTIERDEAGVYARVRDMRHHLGLADMPLEEAARAAVLAECQ